ncbi:MAG: metalloregulator ArsR/SmtB family transcription factor [Pyrinomonadaceae bacterium]
MNNEAIDGLENLFLALADKTRIKLLSLMAAGEVSVGYLADQLGESQPKISRHLAYLRTAGLVSTRREGKWIYYGIEPQHEAVGTVLNAALEASVGKTSHTVNHPAASSAQRYEGINEVDHRPDSEVDELPVYLL